MPRPENETLNLPSEILALVTPLGLPLQKEGSEATEAEGGEALSGALAE